MARVLVTGGAGFLGSGVVEALAARGDEVIALDLVIGDRLRELARTFPTISMHAAEVTEWARVAAILQGTKPDSIVHCAAIVGVAASVEAPFRTFQVNVEGSLNLLEGMRLFGVKRMVHISSEETYGHFTAPKIDEEHPQRPLMHYGVSKLAVEHLGQTYGELYGLECIHLRTSWVYGPRLPRPRIPKNFVDAALEKRPLHLPAGASFAVDHTHVDDLVQGVLLALDHERHPHYAYNIGSGEAPTVQEIVDIVKQLVPGADLSAGPGPYTHPGGLPVAKKGALDITRARTVLGYRPKYNIRDGLAEYVRVARSNQTVH
jgi:nucleoside-diphosphate-sugar epimerase